MFNFICFPGVDPGPFFSSHPVQYLLKELTKFDKEIVFRHRKTEANTVRARPKFQTGFINRFGKPKATLKAPEYVFMTDEDLENVSLFKSHCIFCYFITICLF